jgi:hypothetical protein
VENPKKGAGNEKGWKILKKGREMKWVENPRK